MNPFETEPSEPKPQLVTTLPPEGLFSGPPYVHVPTSHKKLIRGILITIFIAAIVGAAYWAYQNYLTPLSMARIASNGYVTALTTDDVDRAAYMSSDEADFSLLESAAQSVQGTYTVARTAERGGAYYFLYNLSNAANKHARTIVVKTSKGYRISSFVYSGSAIALLPESMATTVPGGVASVGAPIAADSSDTAGSGAGTSASAGGTGSAGSGSGSSSGSTVATACLAQSNYLSAFDDADEATWSASSPYSVQISFNPGTADYVDEFEIGDLYAQWLKFYQANPNKNYTIHVTGSTSDAANDLTLATQRSDTSRAALTHVGVPSSKLITDQPTFVTLDSDSTEDGYVTLTIIPGQGC